MKVHNNARMTVHRSTPSVALDASLAEVAGCKLDPQATFGADRTVGDILDRHVLVSDSEGNIPENGRHDGSFPATFRAIMRRLRRRRARQNPEPAPANPVLFQRRPQFRKPQVQRQAITSGSVHDGGRLLPGLLRSRTPMGIIRAIGSRCRRVWDGQVDKLTSRLEAAHAADGAGQCRFWPGPGARRLLHPWPPLFPIPLEPQAGLLAGGQEEIGRTKKAEWKKMPRRATRGIRGRGQRAGSRRTPMSWPGRRVDAHQTGNPPVHRLQR